MMAFLKGLLIKKEIEWHFELDAFEKETKSKEVIQTLLDELSFEVKEEIIG